MQITKQEYRRFIFESDVSPNAKLTVFAILEYYNNTTGECYPSQQSIATDCGFCKNTASRAIQEAEKAGLFDIKKVRMSGNRFTINTYHFPFLVPKFGTSSEPSNEPSSDHSNEPSNERAKFGNKPIEPIEPKNDIRNKFEEWYNLYPRKEARGKAEPAYKKAIKDGATHEEIIRGLKSFNEKIRKDGTERKYIALPASWLNAERWKDQYEEKPKVVASGGKSIMEEMYNVGR